VVIKKSLVLLLALTALISFESHAAKPFCGDNKCNGGETALTCAPDCDASAGFCGDGTCDASESCSTCENDCGVCPPASACNNDGTCNLGEDCLGCPMDCAGVTSGKKSDRFCCGGATVETLYCGAQCDADCGTPAGPGPVCGNGVLELPDEECDDGNTVDGDGCSATCTNEPVPVCGNNIQEAGEECDDGNTANGDGCSATCTIEYVPVCGNDILDVGEECDDGNIVNGDGCSASCTIEYVPVCGNNILDAGEQCDDGNIIPGDGCDGSCQLEPVGQTVPLNQFNIGDSIGEAQAANGSIGSLNHQSVWSTGYDVTDPVESNNEIYEARDAVAYYENSSTRDDTFNHALSGAVMADFANQAQQVVNATAATPSGSAGQVSILLGNNDVCADTLASMTDLGQFETQLRAGLEILAGNESTRLATIHVSSLPAIYWLWESRADDSPFSWCKILAWPNVPCQNLLANSGDDCASLASREDPDTIYPGDGSNCQRRKQFHARIRDEYNPVLQSVVAEYVSRPVLPLPNAEYIDIFNVRFDAVHVNGGDCFHPSLQGHDLLSHEEYCRSSWSAGDAACAP